MKLVSSAFADGAAVPRRFTCDGENLSPPLQWPDAPGGTRSFVLLCEPPEHLPAHGTTGRPTIFRRQSRNLLSVPRRTRTSSRRLTIFANWGMAARVRTMAMNLTTTTSGCSRSRPSIFRQRPMRPALRSSERHASTPSRRRPSSVGMRDGTGRSAAHPCVKSPGFNPSALTAASGSVPNASTLSFGAMIAATIASALAGSPSATK